MTHRDHRSEFEFEAQADSTSPTGFQEVLELLADHGFEGMAQAMQMLLNEAMKLERSQVLGAQPYQCTFERRGYANGYKPKAVETRLGRLKLAVAEMYLQGVSTRKVTAINPTTFAATGSPPTN